MNNVHHCLTTLAGEAEGPILSTTEALSFWGGVSPPMGKSLTFITPCMGEPGGFHPANAIEPWIVRVLRCLA